MPPAPATDRPVIETTVHGTHTGLWNGRHLARALARRDLQARYKSTMLGWAWSLLVPIAQITVYSIVFSIIFRAAPPEFGNGRPGIFWVWLVVGFAAWNVWSGGISRGVGSVIGVGGLLDKVYFPSYVATMGGIFGLIVQSSIEFTVVLAILAFFGNVGWTWLLAPALFLLLAVFAGAVGYCLGLANAYYRDVGMAVPVLLQMGFFMSGVIFPFALVPEVYNGIPLHAILSANPLAQVVEAFRNLLYDLQLPSIASIAYISAWALASVLLAWVAFRRWGQDVGEVL